MSERASQFVFQWTENHLSGVRYDPEGDNTRARALAPRLLDDARAAGIPREEVEETIGDVVSYIAEQIKCGTH
jgi:hypothetical protein